MVEAGKPAPDFTLLDQQGKKVTLSKLKGSPVVLYFYPKDDTSGCTAEAIAFNALRAKFAAAGVREDRHTIIDWGGGISATIDLFLLHQFGFDDLTLYDGSMGEWARDAALPSEKG